MNDSNCSVATAVVSFESIYERYQGLPNKAARRILRDPDRAQDAAQETWLRISRHLGSYRGGNIGCWIWRVAIREAFRIYRGGAKYDAMQLAQSPNSAQRDGEHSDFEEENLDKFVGSEPFEQNHVERAIQNLPEAERAAILRHLRNEESGEGVAYDPSELWYLHRGRVLLREALRLPKVTYPARARHKVPPTLERVPVVSEAA